PDNRRASTDIKLLGRRAPRRPAFNFRNHSRPHVFRIGLRHRPASQNRINADRLSHPSPSENLLDSIGTEHALDVSVKETSVCIVDDAGKIVREVKVASEPEALLAVLKNLAYHFKRVGLEAGPLSQWLFSALAEAGLPVICVETRHMQAVLKAQINKTDRNDA